MIISKSQNAWYAYDALKKNGIKADHLPDNKLEALWDTAVKMGSVTGKPIYQCIDMIIGVIDKEYFLRRD